MPPDDTKQFLLTLNVPTGDLKVTEFGADLDAALRAYGVAEAEHRGDPDFDVVLIGSDSLETIRVTHASYFGGAAKRLRRMVADEMAHRAAA